jgi:hypothetical protein
MLQAVLLLLWQRSTTQLTAELKAASLKYRYMNAHEAVSATCAAASDEACSALHISICA